MKKITIPLLLALVLMTLTSCKKDFLNTKPSSAVSGSVLFTTLNGADILITGTNRYRFVWGGVNPHQYNVGEKSHDLTFDNLGEDMYATFNGNYGSDWVQKQELHRDYSTTVCGTPWNFFYRMIDNVNQLIDNIDNITDGTAQEIEFYRAQALIYRAHYYHRLVQAYAKPIHTDPDALGVPLNLTSTSPALPRSTVAQVYAQILADLKQAEGCLTNNPVRRRDQSFADLSVVQGLLARVYMCQHNWADAESYANKAKAGYSFMTKAQFRNGFYQVNNEWMWASIAPADEHQNAPNFFSEMSNHLGYPAAWGFKNCVNVQLYLHADTTDCRFHGVGADGRSITDYVVPGGYPAGWKQVYYNKYRCGQQAFAIPYMRAAEMYLIEAEAQCMQGKYSQARTNLKSLMDARSDIFNTNAIADADLLDEIKMQRRMEFWGEGHRFFDLKRYGEPLNRTGNGHHLSFLGRANIPVTDNYWQFLIPRGEIESNGLIVQND